MLGAIILLLGVFLVQTLKQSFAITTTPAEQQILIPMATMIPVKQTDQVMGNPGAKLLIIEFADLGNKESQTIHSILSNFVTTHPRDMRLVFKHAPLYHFFVNTPLTHQAAYCAGKQGKLFAFVNELITKNNSLREAGLKKSAEGAGVDMNNWWECANSVEAQQAVQSDVALAQSFALGKPPLIFINNQKLNLTKDVDLTQLLTSLIQP